VALALYNLVYWPYLLLSCAVLFWPALLLFVVTAPFDAKRRLLRRYTARWGAHYLTWAPGAGVRVQGLERVPASSCIFVANHQSMCDILALYATHLEFAWVSKIENFYAPFMGWNMWLNGYVALRRGHLGSIRRMLRACEKMLATGQSLCVFPEGTRSPDGNLIGFYRGAFWLAARANVPIVPLVLEGTREVLPKGKWRVTPRIVDLHVLAPVRPEEAQHDSRRLRDLVKQRMADELQRIRRGAG
jgi:1-acyl-sn-glycerol-3-phosphate acyltransferase